jgi:chromosome segregation ATPase
MSQIEELQHRIIAAMERIGSGVEALQHTAPGSGVSDEALQAALEEERVANAQLQERLKVLKDQHEQEADELRNELEELRSTSDEDSESDSLREELAQATAKLVSVEAARAELADAKAALENSEELDALKAENAKLRSELDAREDPAPLRAELEQLQALMSQAKQIEAENARLRSELADTERVGDLSAELEMLRAERTSHGAAMSRLDDDLQRMRKANEQLRSSVDELRAAAEDGVPDAELLNRATVAELEATRAAQATDAAEAHAVLARLEPLLSQAKLAEGEVE